MNILKMANLDEKTLTMAGSKVVSNLLKNKDSEQLQRMAISLLNSLSKEEAIKVIEIANGIAIGSVDKYRKHIV